MTDLSRRQLFQLGGGAVAAAVLTRVMPAAPTLSASTDGQVLRRTGTILAFADAATDLGAVIAMCNSYKAAYNEHLLLISPPSEPGHQS